LNTVSLQQLDKLILRLEKMLTEMDMTQSLALYRAIDDSFHMQKIEELRLLHTQLSDAMHAFEKIQRRAYEHYKSAYCQWKKDVRVVGFNYAQPDRGLFVTGRQSPG
jgi:hypothetical protein